MWQVSRDGQWSKERHDHAKEDLIEEVREGVKTREEKEAEEGKEEGKVGENDG